MLAMKKFSKISKSSNVIIGREVVSGKNDSFVLTRLDTWPNWENSIGVRLGLQFSLVTPCDKNTIGIVLPLYYGCVCHSVFFK